MAEDVFLDSLPELRAPVSALWSISQDPTLKTSVPLANGHSATALEIQRWYLDAARAYFEHPENEEQEILERWSQVLSELARDPRLTIGKLDWVTKKDLLEKQMSPSSGWKDDAIKALDFRYHSLRRGSSVYGHLLDAGLMERLVREEEVECGLDEPPPFTRARMRAVALRRGVFPSDWTEFEIGGNGEVDDPFDWASVTLLLRMNVPPDELFEWLSAACDLGAVQVRVQALGRLAELASVRSALGLRSQICERLIAALADGDWRVRLAAVQAMSTTSPRTFFGALRQASQDADYRVRFAAETASAGDW
jgi:hypothetical protein